jgi:hypothetical protein
MKKARKTLKEKEDAENQPTAVVDMKPTGKLQNVMKFKQTGICLISFLCAAFSVHATDQAQFQNATLSGTNSNPVAVSFPGGTILNPTSTNSFTVSISNSISGESGWASTTIPGVGIVPGDPTSGVLSQAQLSTAISNTMGITSLDLVSFKAAGGATVTITLNFSNLPGGYLPAGSILDYIDVDHSESAVITGTSGWFNLATISTLDITAAGGTISPGEPAPNSTDMPTFAGTSTTLTLSGNPIATDTSGVLIPLATNLTSLVIVATGSGSATFFQGLALSVPEPASPFLLGLGAVPVLFAQWARRKNVSG